MKPQKTKEPIAEKTPQTKQYGRLLDGRIVPVGPYILDGPGSEAPYDASEPSTSTAGKSETPEK